MAFALIILACSLAAVGVSAQHLAVNRLPAQIDPAWKQFEQAVIPRLYQGVKRTRVSEKTPFASQQGYTLSGFKHENCGGANDLIKINHLNVASNLLITASITLNGNIIAPVQLELEVYKKILFFIKVPCTSNVGSCTYPNVCAALDAAESCHPQAEALGLCKCPFSAATHEVKDLDLLVTFLNEAEIPPVLESMLPGDWRVQANVVHNGQRLGCVKIHFTLHD